MLDAPETKERVAAIESRLAEIEGWADAHARASALAVVQGVLELYGEGLARVMEIAASQGGAPLCNALADDELVGHLLLIHGVHPVDTQTRVLRALEEVRPYLASHGGDVALLRLEDGVVYLQLRGSCNGCPSSTATLKQAIEEAILRTAPDVDRIEAEGAVGAGAGVELELLPLLESPTCPIPVSLDAAHG